MNEYLEAERIYDCVTKHEHMNKINCILTYLKYVSYEINIDSNLFLSLDFFLKNAKKKRSISKIVQFVKTIN